MNKCRRCGEYKKIIGFGYCRECAKELGADVKADVKEESNGE